MKNKKLIFLIIGIIILISAAIFTLLKAKWVEKEKQEVINTAFQLNDTLSGFSMNLPSKPTKTIEEQKENNIVFKITNYKCATPANNEIVMSILTVKCDTCSIENKNELIMRFLLYLLKSKNISIDSGQDYKMGNYNAFRFEQTIEGIPMEYVTCTLNDKGYIYGETFSKGTKSVSSKYFKSIDIK